MIGSPSQCYRVIYGYIGFSVMNIFFLITGLLFIQVRASGRGCVHIRTPLSPLAQLLQIGNVHVDAFSLCYMLWNFSVRILFKNSRGKTCITQLHHFHASGGGDVGNSLRADSSANEANVYDLGRDNRRVHLHLDSGLDQVSKT